MYLLRQAMALSNPLAKIDTRFRNTLWICPTCTNDPLCSFAHCIRSLGYCLVMTSTVNYTNRTMQHIRCRLDIDYRHHQGTTDPQRYHWVKDTRCAALCVCELTMFVCNRYPHYRQRCSQTNQVVRIQRYCHTNWVT